MNVVEELAAQPGAVLFMSLIFWVINVLMLRLLMSDLLRMHKSKTAVKKIDKQYTFWQKLRLQHVSEHCEHALKFCRFMIRVHNIYIRATGLCLIFGLFLPNRWFAYVTAGKWVLFDLPIGMLLLILDEHPFMKRKHQWRFAKYHNTSDKTSLF